MTAERAASIRWSEAAFGELSAGELYALLRLRSLVFVVEQECPFLDLDGRDQDARHLLGWTEDGTLLAAYARFFAPGAVFPEASIGRIVTHPQVRGTGAGKALMAEALRRVEALAPGAPIRLCAQLYLERFYGGFGFRPASQPYLEDGIPHVEMVRPGTG
ncbi:GNAT family N-acetyltransferase [soil metagenome]